MTPFLQSHLNHKSILLKNHPPAKSLEGRCLQPRKLSESETPLGAASDSLQGKSGQSGFFSEIISQRLTRMALS